LLVGVLENLPLRNFEEKSNEPGQNKDLPRYCKN
jgi:hypothetical protein